MKNSWELKIVREYLTEDTSQKMNLTLTKKIGGKCKIFIKTFYILLYNINTRHMNKSTINPEFKTKLTGLVAGWNKKIEWDTYIEKVLQREGIVQNKYYNIVACVKLLCEKNATENQRADALADLKIYLVDFEEAVKNLKTQLEIGVRLKN